MITKKSKWTFDRSKNIGASEVSSLFNFIGWKSYIRLWQEKTGKLDPDDISDKICVETGNLLEPYVLNKFEELTGKEVLSISSVQSNDFPRLWATPDAVVIEEGLKIPIEAKTTSEFNLKDFSDNDNATRMKLVYFIQLHAQMLCLGAPYGYLVCLFGNRELRWERVERDEKLITDILSKCKEFYEYVDNDIPPAKEYIKEEDKDIISLYTPDELLDIDFSRYDEINSQIKILQGELEGYKARIKKALLPEDIEEQSGSYITTVNGRLIKVIMVEKKETTVKACKYPMIKISKGAI